MAKVSSRFYNHVPPLQAHKYNAACHCFELQGKYQVYCLRCGDEIGRMDGETVQRAIMLTAGRGGVLCPECRKRTCDYCGFTHDPFHTLKEVGDKRACWFCEVEATLPLKVG